MKKSMFFLILIGIMQKNFRYLFPFKGVKKDALGFVITEASKSEKEKGENESDQMERGMLYNIEAGVNVRVFWKIG